MKKFTRLFSLLIAAVIAMTAMCISSSAANYSWTGTWETNWNDMTLTQSGSTVTGSYAYKGGKISGTVSGNTLTGTWTQTNAKGKFKFVMSSDGKSFSGSYGYNDSAPGSSGWDGKRKTSVTYSDSTSKKPSASLSNVSWDNNAGKISFTIKFADVKSGAWVGIVPSGTADDENSADKVDVAYKYLSSLTSGGKTSLSASGLKAGKYELRVYADDNGGALLARAKFTVTNKSSDTVNNTSSSIQYLTLILEEGDTLKIGAVITGSGKVTYSSSASSIVSVNSNGKIKAKNAGTAYITVKCGSSSMKVKVTVTEV
ncbi:MAG: Ig-like domain-containing protein [Ruminiclostridium sp.]|nr:Ig-like domain-containing protein [Ruminiclostridium sp.]